MAETNVHEGHRKRLKDRFLQDGLAGFQDHNVLELLLFYAVPRQDTNPLAHRLIKRFGSVSGVLSAGVDELCTVEGVGMQVATFLKLFPAVTRYTANEVGKSERYDSLNKLGKLLVQCFAGLTVENVLLVLMDGNSHILDIVTLTEGSVNQVRMDTRSLVEHAIRTNASMAVLAHNHPSGILAASTEDLAVTEAVAKALDMIDVHFIDHILVAGNRFDSIWSKRHGLFCQKVPKSFYSTADGDLELE